MDPYQTLMTKIGVDRRSGKTSATIPLEQLEEFIRGNYETCLARDRYGELLERIASRLPTEPEWDAIGITESIARMLDEDNIYRPPNYEE